MGRPSKLTEPQRTEIKRRLIEGEKPADLAREFKVSKSMISGISKRAQEVQSVANQVVTAEQALGDLSVSEQLMAVNLVGRLRSITTSLAAAADLSAKTSHRLMALANEQVNKVDDADPLNATSTTFLKNVGILTKLGNDSAHVSLNLLSANKDTVKRLNDETPPDESETMTPERMADGARRLAFVLTRADRAMATETPNG